MSIIFDATLYLGLFVVIMTICVAMTLKPKPRLVELNAITDELIADRFVMMINDAKRSDYRRILIDMKEKLAQVSSSNAARAELKTTVDNALARTNSRMRRPSGREIEALVKKYLDIESKMVDNT